MEKLTPPCDPLTCVQQQVVLQVGLLAESPVTDVALVGPRAAVHVHVRAQIPGGRERLGAHGALVWLVLETLGLIIIIIF